MKDYRRLAELEDKIERGELISTAQDERGEQETTFFTKHDIEVCEAVVKECLQVLRDMRITYVRDDYDYGWNIGIATAIERLAEKYCIDIEEENDDYIERLKRRAEVAEKDLERHKRALYYACKASGAVLTKELVRARVDCFLRKAERKIEEDE